MAVPQVILSGQKAEHFERGFFGMNLRGFHGLPHAVFEKFFELLLIDHRVGHGLMEFKAGDLRERSFDVRQFPGDGNLVDLRRRGLRGQGQG